MNSDDYSLLLAWLAVNSDCSLQPVWLAVNGDDCLLLSVWLAVNSDDCSLLSVWLAVNSDVDLPLGCLSTAVWIDYHHQQGTLSTGCVD